MQNIFTIDVEDWYHILDLRSAPDLDSWNALENRVRSNFLKLLDTCDEAGIKTTCFFLGWIAEKNPGLVKEAVSRGHEVASHGYAHQLVYTQTQEEFAEDLRRSKAVLEDISGEFVAGFRAPGFSITEETPWAFEEIVKAGFTFDSSVFPASRAHGGLSAAYLAPHEIETRAGKLVELPITVTRILGQRMCLFGGGYLRVTPYALIKSRARNVNSEGRPVVYYIHPREIDPDHPRLPMGRARAFKAYVNLDTTMPKIERILSAEELVPATEWISKYRERLH